MQVDFLLLWSSRYALFCREKPRLSLKAGLAHLQVSKARTGMSESLSPAGEFPTEKQEDSASKRMPWKKEARGRQLRLAGQKRLSSSHFSHTGGSSICRGCRVFKGGKGRPGNQDLHSPTRLNTRDCLAS